MKIKRRRIKEKLKMSYPQSFRREDREDIFGYVKRKVINKFLGRHPEKGEDCWKNCDKFTIYKDVSEKYDVEDYYYVKITSEYVTEWKTYYTSERVQYVANNFREELFFQEILDHYLRLTPPNSPKEYKKIKELATQVFKTKIKNHDVHDFCACKVELCFCKWDTDCHCTFC